MAEALGGNSAAQSLGQDWPSPTLGDYAISDFALASGEIIPSLSLHYKTLGVPRASNDGRTTNAVLVMHGTGGSSGQFLHEYFAGELFGPGQPLDARDFYIILRDGIGHGRSSRPSHPDGNGEDARVAGPSARRCGMGLDFPHYRYDDMVHADHRLLTEHLGVNHLRLVMGTSMGGMQTWLWGETYPDFMDALMPLASLPVQIAGRNRMWRKMAMDAIRSDLARSDQQHAAQDASHTTEQQQPGLTTALDILTLMSSSPLQYQQQCPTRDAADAYVAEKTRSGLESTNAPDLLYALDASRDYDPQPDLHKITAPLLAVNSADDQINPPELGILEREVEMSLVSCPWAKAVVLPITKDTRGHGSHTWAALWKTHLLELLNVTEKTNSHDVRSSSRLSIELALRSS